MRGFFQQKDTLDNPYFIADVISNNDPTGNYRIKVRIPQIHDDIKDENLPWAAKLGPSFLGLNGSYTNHSVPEIGTKVLILAVGNNLNSLIYLGILCRNENQGASGEAYAGTFGIYTASGEFIGVNKITKTLQLIYEGHINIDKILDGKINISDKLDVTCPITNWTGDINIKGNVNIIGNTDITGEQHITGQLTSDTEVKAKAVTLTGHTHLYNPGPGDPIPSEPGQG